MAKSRRRKASEDNGDAQAPADAPAPEPEQAAGPVDQLSGAEEPSRTEPVGPSEQLPGYTEPAPTELPTPTEQLPRFAEPSRTERVYAVAFGRVWLAALAAARAMARWTVTDSNPVRGEISIEARGLLSKTVRAARVRIALDEVGLTRVDAVFLDPSGARAEGTETRQIDRFQQQLETVLRRDTRA